MSLSDKNQKSDEAFNMGRQSSSSGSRRVMWKLNEEETFDTVVNCRCSQNSNAKNVTVTAEIEKSRGTDYWACIYNLIKTKQFAEELAKPSLALRYKPSSESLKYKRSREKQQQQQEKTIKGEQVELVVTECCLTPLQCAVVQETEPKFAQVIPNADNSDEEMTTKTDIPTVVATVNNALKNNMVTLHTIQAKELEVVSQKLREKLDSSLETLLSITKTSPSTPTKQGNKKCTAKSINSNQKAANNAPAKKFNQRQQELHRYRIQVEQRRLQLLDLKIAREREKAIRQEILFQKNVEFKYRK